MKLVATMSCEEKWKHMMTDIGGDTKITDLWRMSALLVICLKGVRVQMLLLLAQLGAYYQTLKAQRISYSTDNMEQSRGANERHGGTDGHRQCGPQWRRRRGRCRRCR